MMLTAVAYAMGGNAQGQPAGGGIASLLPILIMFVIFYFLLIRPQQKQAKKHQEFLRALKAGDRVITSGGLHGVITGLTDTTVTLEVADKVRVKVSRAAVSGSSQEAAADKKE
jgi:preprotein translocase subunit YajC